MTDPNPYAAAPAASPNEERRRRGRRVLYGCALVAGIVLVGFILVSIFGGIWAVGRGSQVPPQTIVAPDVAGAAIIAPLADDDGAVDLVVYAMTEYLRVTREMQREQMAEIHPGFASVMTSLNAQEVDADSIRGALVEGLAVVLEVSQDRDDEAHALEGAGEETEAGDGSLADAPGLHFATAVNLPKYPRLIKLIFRLTRRQTEDNRYLHDGHEILVLEGANGGADFAVAWWNNTLLISSSTSLLEDSLDRVDARMLEANGDLEHGYHLPGPPSAATASADMVLATHEAELAQFSGRKIVELIERTFGGPAPEVAEASTLEVEHSEPVVPDDEGTAGLVLELVDQLEGLTLDADVVSSDETEFVVTARLPGVDLAESAAALLRVWLDERIADSRASTESVELDSATVERDGSRVIITVGVAGVESWITSYADILLEEMLENEDIVRE